MPGWLSSCNSIYKRFGTIFMSGLPVHSLYSMVWKFHFSGSLVVAITQKQASVSDLFSLLGYADRSVP